MIMVDSKLECIVVVDAFLACLFSNCSLLEELTLKECNSITKLHVIGSKLHVIAIQLQ